MSVGKAAQLAPVGTGVSERAMERDMRVKLGAAIVLVGMLVGAHGALAQAGGTIVGTPSVVSTTPISPFAIVGYIQDFKLTPPRGPHVELSGATMTVNGQVIIIPDNTVVIMPAAILTVYDLFHMAAANNLAANLANQESGLALHDINKPLAAFETSITGNIVNGQYIAGLITIFQELAQIHQGYITNIDYATGDFCVSNNAVPPATLGAPRAGCLVTEDRVKLNDPVGRFGKQRTEGDQDPRFVVDDGNPTIKATTGYPMCIPRVAPPSIDPLCPITNRPVEVTTGRPLTRFVMDTVDLPPVVPGAAPLLGSTNIPSCRKGLILGVLGRDCDSRQQVPFMIGDFVTISATLGQDSSPVNGGQYLSAWNVEGTVGVYTKPCGIYGINPITDPTGAIAGGGTPNTKCNPLLDISYMEWEVAIVGTKGTAGPPVILEAGLVETSDRLKVVGMTTDPTRQVEIYAVDTNNNLRWITNVVPLRAPFGRFFLFVQKDVIARLPIATTGGTIPIVDNHLGIDFGAPRQIYVHQAKGEAILTRKNHNVKPVPGVCGGLTTPGCPPLNGGPVPTPADLINPATGKVFVIANGLVPAQYEAPSVAYVFPETVQIGDPLTPNNFECLDFVVKGWQVSTPALAAAGLTGVGQLNPWPGGETGGATPPPPTEAGIACTPR
jgi:hypothetical protein